MPIVHSSFDDDTYKKIKKYSKLENRKIKNFCECCVINTISNIEMVKNG